MPLRPCYLTTRLLRRHTFVTLSATACLSRSYASRTLNTASIGAARATRSSAYPGFPHRTRHLHPSSPRASSTRSLRSYQHPRAAPTARSPQLRAYFGAFPTSSLQGNAAHSTRLRSPRRRIILAAVTTSHLDRRRHEALHNCERRASERGRC